MNEIRYKYFLGEGAAIDAVIQAGEDLTTAQSDRLAACLQKYGADCLWGGTISGPNALGWKWESENHKDRPPRREHFLKPSIEYSDGQRYAIYKPDQRYKEGKAIRKDIADVGLIRYSDSMVKILGIERRVFGVLDGRQVVCSASVGRYGRRLIARVPVGGDHVSDFAPPEGFREIKKSEFVAITEEGE